MPKLHLRDKIRCMLAVFKALKFFLQEAFSITKIKLKKNDDKEFLYMLIKKRAHRLEKELFRPSQKASESQGRASYNRLKMSLETWKHRGYEETAPIAWAEKVLQEYKGLIDTGRGCPNLSIEGREERKVSVINSSDLLKLMKTRRSRRVFLSTPVTSEEKELLVEAGLWAPNSCNRQPLRFLFVENQELKKYISKTVSGGKMFFNKGHCIMLILVDKRGYKYPQERFTPYQDAAAAIQNILLMAESLNLGCCWGSYTSYSSVFSEKDVRKRLGIPEHYLIAGAIAVGRTSQVVCPTPRDRAGERYSVDKF